MLTKFKYTSVLINPGQNQLTGYGIHELAFRLDFSKLTKLILGTTNY